MESAIRTATIRENTNAPVVGLELRKDPDAYRWYEAVGGADTEVSGRTIAVAIGAARAAWRAWAFRLRKNSYVEPEFIVCRRCGYELPVGERCDNCDDMRGRECAI